MVQEKEVGDQEVSEGNKVCSLADDTLNSIVLVIEKRPTLSNLSWSGIVVD